MRTHGGCDSEQGDCHESGNQQTLHETLRWFDMQRDLQPRNTANGHRRMWPASPITNLFLAKHVGFAATREGDCIDSKLNGTAFTQCARQRKRAEQIRSGSESN
jgi:hypothetical protein